LTHVKQNASHVTYCPSLEATLSHCVSYLTLCLDRVTMGEIERYKREREEEMRNQQGG
jgi:hypothetical protein